MHTQRDIIINSHQALEPAEGRSRRAAQSILSAVLKVDQERSRVSPEIRGRVHPPQNFLIYF